MKKLQKMAKVWESFHKKTRKKLEGAGFYGSASLLKSTPASRMSEAGYEKWAEIEGFRKFLALTEADRMAMLESPKRTPDQFSEFLPYAIALGVEKEWAKQFKDIEIKVDDWYVSNRAGLDALVLSNALGGGLKTFGTVASASSGSSGAGGGFSGGGFSGGGGGSW